MKNVTMLTFFVPMIVEPSSKEDSCRNIWIKTAQKESFLAHIVMKGIFEKKNE